MDCAALIADYFDPVNYNSLEPTPGVPLRWHERLEVMGQGTRWHRAGLASTAEQHSAIAAAERAVYPEGLRLVDRRVFGTDSPQTVVLQWLAEGTTWDGRQCRNSGLSVFEFEDGVVRRARHYTNTSYLETIEEGWEALLPIGTLIQVPAFHTLDLPPGCWRPYPIAVAARTAASSPLGSECPLTSAQRLARLFDPAHRLLEAPAEYHYGTAPGAWMEFQGTTSVVAGRNVYTATDGEGTIDPVMAAVAHIYDPSVFRLSHMMTWQADEPDWAIMEWVSDGLLWDGRPYRNAGLTTVQFNARGERRILREYLNVAYIEAVTAGWRERVPEAVFATLACAKSCDLPADKWSPLPITDEPSTAEASSGSVSTAGVGSAVGEVTKGGAER